jgi:hypothetical protein
VKRGTGDLRLLFDLSAEREECVDSGRSLDGVAKEEKKKKERGK